MNKKDTLDSMGDHFLEMRFDPKYREIFQKKIESLEADTPERKNRPQIDFSGSFDQKTKRAVENIVSGILEMATNFELTPRRVRPAIAFFTPTSWRETVNTASKKIESLPASRIDWREGVPTIQIIIPEKIVSGDVVIKTVRSLFSKLFGRLFFEEWVMSVEPGSPPATGEMEESVGLKEKSHFCRLRDDFSDSARHLFIRIGKKTGVKGGKAEDVGKREFFNHLNKKGNKRNKTYVALLEKIFTHHVDKFVKKPESLFDELAGKICDLIPQTNFILPHELRDYTQLRLNKQWTFFHGLANRLQFIQDAIDEVNECFGYLATMNLGKPIDYLHSDFLLSALHEREKQLGENGLIKPFLFEGVRLTEKQKKERRMFPLWIWRHQLFTQYPASKNPETIVRLITDRYSNSIFHKLLELNARLERCVKAAQKTEEYQFEKSSEYRRIQTLIAWLDLRRERLTDVMFSCKIGTRILRAPRGEEERNRKKKALANFEKGWSYFVSFALIHQYYLKSVTPGDKREKRSERYYSIIDRYIRERIGKQDQFRVSRLLMSLYKKSGFNLSQITELIKNDTELLHFFALNQERIFNNTPDSPGEIIERYAAKIQF